MKILIDVKNLALYKGGISSWIEHQLENWFEIARGQQEFILLYPTGTELNRIGLSNADHKTILWPSLLHRKLRHIWYDNVLFPREVRKIKPQFLFSPYHDVRLPKKTSNLYSVITVHDLCFLDVPQAYPWFVRAYYIYMLGLNLSRAHHVITVSEATRERLIQRYRLPNEMISIVPNSINSEFLKNFPSEDITQSWRNKFGGSDGKIVLYSSGMDHRKNVARLLQAFRSLWKGGYNITLCITGNCDTRWQHLFLQEELSSGKVSFLGYLSLPDLRLAYQGADLVIYPSLCEGFGRACIEAMACGTPLACSDLAVFHEVAGDYACYFDPLDIQAMSRSILHSLQRGRQNPRHLSSYELRSAQDLFIRTINQLLKNANAL